MSKIPLGPDLSRARHGSALPSTGTGWCHQCYEQGAFVLAASADGDRCLLHGAADGAARPQLFGIDAPPVMRPAGRRPPRTPRGRASRVAPPVGPSGRSLPRPVRRELNRAAARALAYGRERARRRVDSTRWAPHPGWRRFIETGWRVLVDQAEALRRVAELVDAEDWRTDKRQSWLQILRRLVHSMDWSTGLVTGLTAERLGAAGDRATRTVSRVLAWARDIGLLVVVETGASAAFLGSRTNRTPSYALVTNAPLPQPTTASPPLNAPVDQSGDLPESLVSSKPLPGGRRPKQACQSVVDWPVFQVPDSPAERTAATLCLFKRMGLDHRGVSAVPLWRARALLKPWWTAGACVAGILYALDHHPDRPNHHRGDALRGATDPIRVIGHRLKPWTGRLNELPATVVGLRGDYRSLQEDKLAQRTGSYSPAGFQHEESNASARAAARAAVAEHLRRKRLDRERRPAGQAAVTANDENAGEGRGRFATPRRGRAPRER